jgi:hypothetical protein
MIRKLSLVFFFIAVAARFSHAAPALNVVPGGIQGGNWVWNISVTPDLSTVSSTPMAVELGFRLSGSPLASAVNINPSEWDTANPGNPIFGWETPDPSANNKPVGLQKNLGTSEVFSAFGSIDFTTPGAKSFLQITAKGPNNGGSSSSTLQWLGAYAVGQGRIAQLINSTTAANFDIFSGTATQIPEPTSFVIIAVGAVLAASWRRRAA